MTSLSEPLELTDRAAAAQPPRRHRARPRRGLRRRAVRADADYWRRVAEGGVGMCIAGGTVIGRTSTYRTRMLTEAWRPESLPGLKLRADAMHEGGAAAVLQILHLGRETLGAEIYYAPVAPSAVRSPREPNRAAAAHRRRARRRRRGLPPDARSTPPRPASTASSCTRRTATCSASCCRRRPTSAPGRETVGGPRRRSSRASPQAVALGGAGPGARHPAVGRRPRGRRPRASSMLGETLAALDPAIDYVNLTVGMRADYVRDMATPRPSLHRGRRAAARADRPAAARLARLPRRRTRWRRRAARAPTSSGMARALIADPDLPRKVLDGPRRRGPPVRRVQRGLPRVRPGAAVHGQPGPRRAGRHAPPRRAAHPRRRCGRRPSASRSSAPGRPAWRPR